MYLSEIMTAKDFRVLGGKKYFTNSRYYWKKLEKNPSSDT